MTVAQMQQLLSQAGPQSAAIKDALKAVAEGMGKANPLELAKHFNQAGNLTEESARNAFRGAQNDRRMVGHKEEDVVKYLKLIAEGMNDAVFRSHL